MLESDNSDNSTTSPSPDQAAAAAEPATAATAATAATRTNTAKATKAAKAVPRKRAAKKATAPVAGTDEGAPAESAPTDAQAPATPRKRAAKKAAAVPVEGDTPRPVKRGARKSAGKATADAGSDVASEAVAAATDAPPAKTAGRTPRKRAASKANAGEPDGAESGPDAALPTLAAPSVLFVPPSAAATPSRPRRSAKSPAGPPPSDVVEPAAAGADITVAEAAEDQTAEPDDVREAAVEEATGARRRRRRGRRGRGGAARGADDGPDDGDESADVAAGADHSTADAADEAVATEADDDGDEGGEDGTKSTGTRRRRRRRSSTGTAGADGSDDDPPNTVVHVRAPRDKVEKKAVKADKTDRGDDGVKGVKGSTRLEAKRQRRRDGRDTGRRRPPILTESEFLARRESVDRVMAVRELGDRTQIAVLEDGILVEHYVTRASATSYVGNVYLGRVQNVLPSMEAAFVDIGKGRNGVLYAGEVNWDAAGLEGKSRAIEHALKSGDVVLVQVTKDPIGHKGARLTSQVSLPGRFLVYVPGGGMTGISRKLPDTERHRLKSIMKKIVPEDAGVIIRTAAEGASEEDLTRDVERLKAQWEKMSKKAEKTSSAPTLVHGEPDLAIRVVRDVFNEDFAKLVVQGGDAWQTVSDYLEGVAPDLAERSARHTAETDLFHDLRVDEQLMKALDRKVYLPSGGSLVIDRTEAMTVIDVNTGKFVGAGGNLEQTVTRNNLEAAEEIVRQLRLRDVGGMIVIDFIDMVLESNRDLVLRRLTECLGRDRTKHQVAEVTSLGLVQMTRKRVGEGLLEAFSEQCPTCNGRGVLLHAEPVDRTPVTDDTPDEDRPKSKRRRGAVKKAAEPVEPELEEHREHRLAAIAAIHRAAHPDDSPAEVEAAALAADLQDEGLPLRDVELADAAEPADAVAVAEDDSVEPVEATAGDSTASVEPDHVEPDHVEPDHVEPDHVEPDQAEPDQVEPDQAEPDQAEPDQAEPVAVRAAPRRRRAASRPAGPPVAVG